MTEFGGLVRVSLQIAKVASRGDRVLEGCKRAAWYVRPGYFPTHRSASCRSAKARIATIFPSRTG